MSATKLNNDELIKLFSDRSFELFLEKYLKDQDMAVPDLPFLKQLGISPLFGNAYNNWAFFDRPYLLVQKIITEYQRTVGSEDKIFDYEKNKVTATNRLAGQTVWSLTSYYNLARTIGRGTRDEAGNLFGAAAIAAAVLETAFLVKNIWLVGKLDKIDKSFAGLTNSVFTTGTTKAKQEAYLTSLKEYKVAMANAKGSGAASVGLAAFVAVGIVAASALSILIRNEKDPIFKNIFTFIIF